MSFRVKHISFIPQFMKYKNLINLFILFFAVFFISAQVWLERFFGKIDFEQLIVFLIDADAINLNFTSDSSF